MNLLSFGVFVTLLLLQRTNHQTASAKHHGSIIKEEGPGGDRERVYTWDARHAARAATQFQAVTSRSHI